MKSAITQNTYDEVSRLVECALSADTKKQAEQYTKRLEFLRSSDGYGGYVNCVLGDLIASTKHASGKVADKERLSSFARTDFYKLEGQISNSADSENVNSGD